jgi:hypothetical protein
MTSVVGTTIAREDRIAPTLESLSLLGRVRSEQPESRRTPSRVTSTAFERERADDREHQQGGRPIA